MSELTLGYVLLNSFSITALFPSKLLEFFLGVDEFNRAIIEQNAAAFWVVVIKSKQLRPAILIPACFSLE